MKENQEFTEPWAEYGHKLPSKEGLFAHCMSMYLNQEESKYVYNILLQKNIINEEGRVIGEDFSGTNISFEKFDHFRKIFLGYCLQLKTVQDVRSSEELRKKIEYEAENMVTGRIMRLIQGEFLSPTIESGLQ